MKNPSGLQAFGTHLRKIREGKSMSQQALADVSNVDKKTIQRIEHAKFSVTLDVLISIAEGLQIPLGELVDYEKRQTG